MTKYINEDTLRKLMYEEAFEKDSDMQKWDSGCWIRYKLFENRLEAVPAADVTEIKHGHWIVSATNLHFDSKCSVCGETFYSPLRGAYIVHHSNYCPKCGAKMDGG